MTRSGMLRHLHMVLAVSMSLAIGACGERSADMSRQYDNGEPVSHASMERRAAHPILPPEAVPARLTPIALPVGASVAELGPTYARMARNEVGAQALWGRVVGTNTTLPVLDWSREALLIVGLPPGVTVPQVHRTDSTLYVLLRAHDPARLQPHAFSVTDVPRHIRFNIR